MLFQPPFAVKQEVTIIGICIFIATVNKSHELMWHSSCMTYGPALKNVKYSVTVTSGMSKIFV